ncbi:MAG: SDR family oxidoreductase [Flavobacteriaceae bacterium]
MKRDLLCLGFGYCAERLADMLRAEGWIVTGTTRDPRKAGQMKASGYRAIDPAEAGAMDKAFSGASHILVSASPAKAGDPFLGMAEAALTRRAAPPEWIGYLSTTGVYGVSDGSTVSEDTPPRPVLQRGKARLEAERAWTALAARIGAPLSIFRLAGIYGPGRSAIDQIRAGTAKRVVKPGQVFNRIHVDDIARILLASIADPAADGIYNVADDMPSPPQDVVAHAANLLGVPPPPETPFEQADLSPMAKSFYEENKLIDNRRVKERLGVSFLYPDYRAGLAAILAQDQQ